MLKKLAAIGLTVGALVLIAPAAANAAPVSPLAAASGSYAEPPRVDVDDPIIDICEVSTIAFGTGYFQPSEKVAVSVSGHHAENASISGATAAADGSMVVTFRPPSDGDGSYAVSFSGSRSYTATITVSQGHDSSVSCDHDPAVAGRTREAPNWRSPAAARCRRGILGGGALALAGGGALVITSLARRKRA